MRPERTPTGRGGRLSLWGLCFTSANQLFFAEGQTLEYLVSLELPCKVLVVREGRKWRQGRHRTTLLEWVGSALWQERLIFSEVSVLCGRNTDLRDVGIGKGNKQGLC